KGIFPGDHGLEELPAQGRRVHDQPDELLALRLFDLAAGVVRDHRAADGVGEWLLRRTLAQLVAERGGPVGGHRADGLSDRGKVVVVGSRRDARLGRDVRDADVLDAMVEREPRRGLAQRFARLGLLPFAQPRRMIPVMVFPVHAAERTANLACHANLRAAQRLPQRRGAAPARCAAPRRGAPPIPKWHKSPIQLDAPRATPPRGTSTVTRETTATPATTFRVNKVLRVRKGARSAP